MKKLYILSLFLLFINILSAQKTKTVTKTTVPQKVVAMAPVMLNNLNDSANYAIGVSVGDFYKSEGIKKLNSALIAKAMNDVYGNKKLMVQDKSVDNLVNQYITKCLQQKSNPKVTVTKSLSDSANYAIGERMALFYKQSGVKMLNTDLIIRGINDVYISKPLYNNEVVNAVMNKYMMTIEEDKVKPAIDAGKAFLDSNRLRQGVITTPSGLQYEVIKQGTGIKPSAVDSVTCHYKGTLLNGTVFDNSYDRGQPITFTLNRVIPGWTEGLQLMNVGSIYKLYVPYNLAYGLFENGPIPGGSLLIFEVELLDVKKAKTN
jgi:FKBP-type peptidyl-prolyl cis-trans isomerase